MRIYTYILCWNEEKILPFTLDHYNQFSDRIFLLDNYSTDKSLEIARKYEKVTVVPWECEEENTYDEYNVMRLRSEVYKDETFGYGARGKADWVIIVDADEFIFHPDIKMILTKYKGEGVGVPRLAGYNMVSKEFPQYKKGELLTQKVKLGKECVTQCKPAIFDPSIDVKFGIGGHFLTEVIGNALPSVYPNIMLLHYKNLGKEYLKERYDQLAPRSSCRNKMNNFGTHWYSKDQRQNMYDSFDQAFEDVTQVIPDDIGSIVQR